MIRRKDIPKEVEVADGIFYKIRFKQKLLANGYYGLCYFDLKEIHISCGLSPVELMDTVTHEILHAIAHENDFELKHDIINVLEGPLGWFIARNTVMIKWQEICDHWQESGKIKSVPR